MKKWIITLIIIIVIAGGVMALVGFNSQQQAQATLNNLETIEISVGTLTASIGATGTVHANQSATLTWDTSGSVDTVEVQIGEIVHAGDILASLGQTSLSQSVILAQADLVNAQKALDDLLNSQQQSAQALLNVEEAEQALEDALNPELAQAQALKAISDAEKAVEEAERYLRNLQSTGTQSSIDAAQARVTIAKDKLDKAQEKYDPYANKPESNLTRANLLSNLSAAQQEYDAAVRELNYLLGTGSDTDVAVAAANLATAQAELTDAQKEYERIQDGATPGEVASLESQLEDAEREWERLKDGPDPDDVAAAEARVAAAEATLAQASITAPFDGIVTMVDNKVGDQVNLGTSAFRIDDLSRLLVDLEVSEVDINQISVGQSVELTFDAIFSEVYQGEVIEVAMVGTEIAGVVNFTVTVELHDPDAHVKPGMTSAVDIVTTQMTDVLTVPNRAVRVVDGERVVYVVGANAQIEAVPVTLGASDGTYSQVLEGDLQVGDQIVLNPTDEIMNTDGGFAPPGQGPGSGGPFGGGQ
jgi:HlyD family secretion protein